MTSQKFNDRTNPQVVMVAYLVPKQIHLVLVRALRYKPAPPLAILLDRAVNEISIVEVIQ